MKKIFSILLAIMMALSFNAAQAASKTEVHNYLSAYRDLLLYLTENPNETVANLVVGDSNPLLNGGGILHAIELIDAILAKKLDDCCWVEEGTGLDGYANGSTTDIIKQNTLTYTDNGIIKTFTPKQSQSADMQALRDMLGDWDTLDPDVFTGIDSYVYKLLIALDVLWDDVQWGYSYLDSQHASLKSAFKNRYIYSCIVCFGGGFYNTAKLFIPNTVSDVTYYSPNPAYYYDVVNPTNFPQTYQWMQLVPQYPAVFTGGNPPQTSIGPTVQGQPLSAQGSVTTANVIYPTHCHHAEEFYKPLDMITMAKNGSDSGDPNAENFLTTYWFLAGDDTRSYATGPVNMHNLPVVFEPDMFQQFQQGHYELLDTASMFYNAPFYMHSMHPGEWLQMAAWARFTNPNEGTYFPLNGGPYPDNNEVCIGDTST